MPQIYVTYRYGDTTSIEHQQLIDFLEQEYGADNVILSQAEEYFDYLDLTELVYQQDAVIVLVGKRFTNIVGNDGKALLWDNSDYLHVELATAIEAIGIRIVMVLTDGANVPEENDLPPALRGIHKYPTFNLDSTKADKFFKKLKTHLDKNVKIRHEFYKSPQAVREHRKITRVPVRQDRRNRPAIVIIMVAVMILFSVVLANGTNFTENTTPTETPVPLSNAEQHQQVIDNDWLYDEEALADGSVTRARRTFGAKCNSCHAINPYNWTMSSISFDHELSPEELYEQIIGYIPSHGVATSPDILPFSHATLTRDEVYDITAYLLDFYSWD